MNQKPFWQNRWSFAALLLGGFLAGVGVSWLTTVIGSSFSFQIDPTSTAVASSMQTLIQTATFTPVPTTMTTPVARQTASPSVEPTATEAQTAADFTLETLDGERVTLSDLRGQVVVLNFWTSWCPPCKDEMPALQAAYDTYSDQGFVVLGVNMTPLDTVEDAQAMVDELQLTFPILVDPQGAVSQDLYRIINLPTSYWIDPQGVIRATFIGAMTEDQIEAQITELLN